MLPAPVVLLRSAAYRTPGLTAHRVGGKCFPTDGRIELAGCVVLERTDAVGRIFNAVDVVIEKRKSTRGRILGVQGVVIKRLKTNGCVSAALCVATERARAVGRVLDAARRRVDGKPARVSDREIANQKRREDFSSRRSFLWGQSYLGLFFVPARK